MISKLSFTFLLIASVFCFSIVMEAIRYMPYHEFSVHVIAYCKALSPNVIEIQSCYRNFVHVHDDNLFLNLQNKFL